MGYNINFDNGMMNFGDFTRIKKAMAKALKGEPVTVGFLGGSITQGSLSSTPETCYAYLVYKWWCETFPQSKVTYINAGIGATNSDYGVARADEDLLCHKPDFMVVEFSVNDENNLHYLETYEGLVRHILKDVSETGLMLVHNVFYATAESAEDKHLMVGKYYDLPCVSMKYSVYPEVLCGNIPARDITPDDLHPNDAGHRLLADLIIHMLELIKAHVGPGDENTEISRILKKPITRNGYEVSRLLNNTNLKPDLMKGFEKDPSERIRVYDNFTRGFTAWKTGDRIEFTVKGSSFSVQFRRSIVRPAPVAIITIDGENEAILDGAYEYNWGDYLRTEPIADNLENKDHKIVVEIIKDHADCEEKDKVPFYLVSIIASNS